MCTAVSEVQKSVPPFLHLQGGAVRALNFGVGVGWTCVSGILCAPVLNERSVVVLDLRTSLKSN